MLAANKTSQYGVIAKTLVWLELSIAGFPCMITTESSGQITKLWPKSPAAVNIMQKYCTCMHVRQNGVKS